MIFEANLYKNLILFPVVSRAEGSKQTSEVTADRQCTAVLLSLWQACSQRGERGRTQAINGGLQGTAGSEG